QTILGDADAVLFAHVVSCIVEVETIPCAAGFASVGQRRQFTLAEPAAHDLSHELAFKSAEMALVLCHRVELRTNRRPPGRPWSPDCGGDRRRADRNPNRPTLAHTPH